MGTRGLLGFVIKGKKKGTYNHFDSYPTGLGWDAMKWIKSLSEEDISKMVAQLEKLEWVDASSKPAQELQDRYSAAGFSRTELHGARLNTGRIDNWYNLLHVTQGAKALPFILDGSLQHLSDDSKFIEDGLFCEWAYYIDFEKRTLETCSSGVSVDVAGFEKLSEEYAQTLQRIGGENEDEDEDKDEDKNENGDKDDDKDG